MAKKNKKKKRTALKTFIVLGTLVVVGLGGYIVAAHEGINIPFLPDIGSKEEPAETVTAEVPANPLTGVTEGFDPEAAGQRTVAFVVENTPDARPQWGMDDPEYSPDIILEGEVEGGITRTLWFYADYNKLPEIIGPMRSARPPYIRFSELFDSVFIHWGQSSSKGNYVGANTVFKQDKVNHINQMTFNDKVGLYGRDTTRSVSSEHRGILYGDKVDDAIKQRKFRTEAKDYTKLSFSPLPWLTTFTPAEQVKIDYSSRTSWETTVWTYDKEDRQYHTGNFRNDLKRDNLLILMDETEYVDKANYKGEAGHTVTYCDYKFAGGKGKILSLGNVRDITWRIEDGKLVLIDTAATKAAKDRYDQAVADGEISEDEEAPGEVMASLNPGKTWIGWVSANHGGEVKVLASKE